MSQWIAYAFGGPGEKPPWPMVDREYFPRVQALADLLHIWQPVDDPESLLIDLETFGQHISNIPEVTLIDPKVSELLARQDDIQTRIRKVQPYEPEFASLRDQLLENADALHEIGLHAYDDMKISMQNRAQHLKSRAKSLIGCLSQLRQKLAAANSEAPELTTLQVAKHEAATALANAPFDDTGECKPKRKGRKQSIHAKTDRKMYDRWKSGMLHPPTFSMLGAEFNMSARDAKKAIDRERKRRQKRT